MFKRILLGALVASCLVSQAAAQSSVLPYWINSSNIKVPTGTGNPLPVTVISGGGGAQTDQSAWSQGVTSFAPNGGVFNDTATLSSGQQGTARLTTKRAAIVDVDTSGNALYSAITSGVITNGSAVPTTSIYMGVNIGGTGRGWTGVNPSGAVYAGQTDVTSINGVTVLTGTGATGTGAQRVTVSTDQATNAGAALVKGGVGTVNGGSDYETVAASQTAQALGATGATGDYLSHCVLQPTTTGAGTMTILDNATVIFTFTTGTLSNLAPIAIPIGAISVSGAWKVTTGANETATCFGKFT